VLLGEGIEADQLNDHTLGRAHDILYKMNIDSFYPTLASKTLEQIGEPAYVVIPKTIVLTLSNLFLAGHRSRLAYQWRR
jgi:hypothetical protein